MYNPLDELGSEVERAFTFENGDILYVDYDEKENILFAGHATNAGVMKEVKIQYDKDDTLYENLERLHKACIEDDPSRLDEEKTTDSKKTEVVMDTKKCDGKTNGNYTFKLSKKKNEYGEYEIHCYKDGKRYPNGDYFTEDWDDAVGTIKDIAKRQGLNFNQKGSIYVADSLRRKTKRAKLKKDWEKEKAEMEERKAKRARHDSKPRRLISRERDSGKNWDDGKKTRDIDWSYNYELIDVEYYPSSLKQSGIMILGALDKSITGVCNLYGIETRKGEKYEDNVLAKFIWDVPENEVRIFISSKRTMPYANTDLKEAEKILLDKLVKNVDTNKYFKDSEPKGKRFKLKTSKRDSAKFIVRRLRRK